MRSLLRWVIATSLWLALSSSGFAAGAPTLIGYGVIQPGRTIRDCTVTPSTAQSPFTVQLGDLLLVDYIADAAFPGGPNNCESFAPGPDEFWNCSVPPGGSDTQIWWRLATSADVAASTFTFRADNSFNVCALYDWRGVDQVTPVGAFVTNTGSGMTMNVLATSGYPGNTSVLLLENQDDANVGGFSIATITPSGSPWSTIVNFNGSSSPFSASFAALDQIGVSSTVSATATMNISDDWATVAIPILAPGGEPGGIFGTLSY